MKATPRQKVAVVSPRRHDALSTQPIYCYAEHQNEVVAFCRKLFIMSPLRVVRQAETIRMDDPDPIFFFVKNHKTPVPEAFWEVLFKNVNTTYVEITLPLDDYITK